MSRSSIPRDVSSSHVLELLCLFPVQGKCSEKNESRNSDADALEVATRSLRKPTSSASLCEGA